MERGPTSTRQVDSHDQHPEPDEGHRANRSVCVFIVVLWVTIFASKWCPLITPVVRASPVGLLQPKCPQNSHTLPGLLPVLSTFDRLGTLPRRVRGRAWLHAF